MKVWLVLAALVAACSSRPTETEPPADVKVALDGATAVRVGGTPIPVSLVAAVASAQKLSAPDAARRLTDDEIAASAARAKGLDRREPTAWNLVSTRARFVADRIATEASSAGPPTDDEIKLLSERHWAEVDRPPTMRVHHAFVFRPKDAALAPAAKALAEKIHAAVADGVTTPGEFESRAKAVPHGKELDVRVEFVGTFAADGRNVEGGGMDETFAAAAGALPAAGAISGVVETRFGWHVIRLLERIPATTMKIEDRRIAFREEAIAMRGTGALSKLTQRLRAQHDIGVSPAAESLMRSVPIGSEPQASLP